MMETIYSILGAVLPSEAYQFTFMKNAFLAVLLLTPLLGLLGTMAVNHQMAFFSDALGHSALTGIGLGIILGLRNDLVAMLVFGIIWAILICVIKQSGSASADTVISVFSSTSVAAGLLILARGGKFGSCWPWSPRWRCGRCCIIPCCSPAWTASLPAAGESEPAWWKLPLWSWSPWRSCCPSAGSACC